MDDAIHLFLPRCAGLFDGAVADTRCDQVPMRRLLGFAVVEAVFATLHEDRQLFNAVRRYCGSVLLHYPRRVFV